MGTIRRPHVKTKGFTLIELLIVISIILVILAIAVPKMNTQMQGAREMAVIREIGSIHQAETQYYSQFGKYATNLVQLGPPVSGADSPEAANIIPKVLADGKKNGYIYTLAATAGGYSIQAVPESFGNSGRRTFYSDQTLVIRNNWGQEPATPTSPEIK
ncbi:MAG TPA: prepilin-type N-terminal cleavage/methylation domain-containing protein [Bryobacteraceae bacterium]|nr:prepilin-type N-terminal cleavage/methylation domain-containing protein [Bryobacteraceae bacterium]